MERPSGLGRHAMQQRNEANRQKPFDIKLLAMFDDPLDLLPAGMHLDRDDHDPAIRELIKKGLRDRKSVV